jgi:hypothetical protein
MKEKRSFTRSRAVNTLGLLLALGLLASLIWYLNTLFASRTQQPPQTASQPHGPTASQSILSTPTIATNQIDQTAGWKTYVSRLGYSVKYPAAWFAAPDPGVTRGDILFEEENFLKIRAGEAPSEKSGPAPYFFVAIQQFTFDNLDLTPTDSIDKVAEAIDRGSFKILREESFQVGGTKSLLRTIEAQGRYAITAYFIHKDTVYWVYSYLDNPQGGYRTEIFEKIASTIQFSS